MNTEVEEVCIVTELMDYDLHTLIAQSKLKPDQIQVIMHQILCGVREMHAAGTLHRDLKPKNVLVNRNLITKVCDLGTGRGNPNSLKMTMISRVATSSYRAPDGILNIASSEAEIASMSGSHGRSGANYTTAVDVWACGCILAEMLTGSPLFPYKENSKLLSAYVEVLGCPALELLKRIPKSSSLTHLENLMQEHQGKPGRLMELLPKHESEAAAKLCTQMLRFDPLDRISLDDALTHPYFDDYEELEAPTIARFSDPTDNPDLDLNAVCLLILQASNSVPTSDLE